MIYFAWPFMFFLLPLPFLLKRLLASFKKSTDSVVKVPFFYEVKALSGNKRLIGSLFRRSFLFFMTAWILLVAAAARPQYPMGVQKYAFPVRDILLVIDISVSMNQEDFSYKRKPMQRLHAVRTVAGEFIHSRKGDRLGIILFSGQANLYVPLTVDYETLGTMLLGAEVGLLGRVTALGDALGLSVRYLEESKAKHKVVVLLTDGVNNAGNVMPLDALSSAKKAGVTVYTIGVGTEKSEGDMGIDKSLLEKIAKETGGLFFMADDFKSLQAAYERISDAEPLSETDVFLQPQKELYPYPLFLFLCLMSGGIIARFVETLRYQRSSKDV